jgi:1,4-alpha-glucan branching enzyme
MRDPKYTYKTIRFNLHAPGAQHVSFAGTFNDWNTTSHPMKQCGRGKNRNGHWQIPMRLLPGTYEYLFVVDGKWWTDPASNQYVANEFGSLNNVIEVQQ